MNERKKLLEQAHQNLAQSNFKATYDFYEQVLLITPNDAEVLQEYGQAKYFEYTDLEQATQLFERAVNVDPNSIPALLWLGDLYALGYGKGYSAALSTYQQVLQLNSRVVDAYIGIGMLHRAPSSPVKLKDAIEAFHTATHLDPERPDTHVNLAMALIEDGDRQNAREELEIAEKLLVQSGEHRQARGIQAVRKKLEANQPVTSVAYSNLSPRYKGVAIVTKAHHTPVVPTHILRDPLDRLKQPQTPLGDTLWG